MTTLAPLWTQDQAIAYEATLEAINDVIAGYSARIGRERARAAPDMTRIDGLKMRINQAHGCASSLNVTDTKNVQQLLSDDGAIVRARNRPGRVEGTHEMLVRANYIVVYDMTVFTITGPARSPCRATMARRTLKDQAWETIP